MIHFLRLSAFIWAPCVATIIIMVVAYWPSRKKVVKMKKQEWEPLESQLN